MSDNNSANNMSDTSFTTPTNQGIGQVPMTPSPPPRSLVPHLRQRNKYVLMSK